MTATAFTHADVLRRIADDQPIPSHIKFASEFGADPSNFRRTLKALEAEGVILRPEGERPSLTDLGRQILRGVDVAEGRADGAGAPAATRWPIDKIRPNPANRAIDAEGIEDMADSILGIGDIIQPLTLTPPDANGVRMILAGERRWRGVRRLMDRDAEAHNEEVLNGGLVAFNPSLPPALEAGVPFVERAADDAEAILITIIENGQREDLTPWEDAQQLLKLAEATGWSGAEIARRTGRLSETRKNGAKDVQDKLKIARQATPEQIEDYQRTGSWDVLRNAALGRKPADPDQRSMLPTAPPTYPLQLFLVEAALRGDDQAGVWDADQALRTGMDWPASWDDGWFTYAALSGHFRLTAKATDWLGAIGLGDDAEETYRQIAALAGCAPAPGVWNSVQLHDDVDGYVRPRNVGLVIPALGSPSESLCTYVAGQPYQGRFDRRNPDRTVADVAPDLVAVGGFGSIYDAAEPGTLETLALPWSRPGKYSPHRFPQAQIEIAKLRGADAWVSSGGYSLSDIGNHNRLSGVARTTSAFPDRRTALMAAIDDIAEDITRNKNGKIPVAIADWLQNPTPAGPHVVNHVDYLNASRAAEARRAAGIDPTPRANYGAAPADPAPAETPAPDVLSERARLALVELSIKVKRAPVAVIPGKPALTSLDGVTSQAWLAYGARIGQYWLDPVANELTRLGLIRIQHLPDHHAPVAILTHDGLDRLSAIDHNVPPNMLDQGLALKAATGTIAPPDGVTYVTPWLEREVEPEVAAPEASAPEAPPVDDTDHWSRDAAAVREDKALLDRIHDFFVIRDDIDEDAARALMAELKVTGPFTEDGDAGIVATIDGDAASLAYVDVERELPPERARGLALMAAWALEVVFGEAAQAAAPEVEAVEVRAPDQPAVPIRKSIHPDYLVCLEDGRKFKSLKRHLRTRYNLSPDEYIARWGLPKDYPMQAPNYARARAELAAKMGLGGGSR
ncbi:MAG: hypothetical protein DI552_00285 [Brevundimonas sp.]|nr:MAG: hypothetical protein DI552_00285 [Brevundimonas sp.]